MNLIGKRLGKYELVELVGKGGMAQVYKAFDPDSERMVAVKVMHRYLSEDHVFVRRFEREAKAISRLKHPNIVGFIDFDHQQDQYYLVMSYIKGGTWREYLQKRGALPALEALPLLLQLTKALAYAHQNGIIHRDIKPSNIMFLDQKQSHPVLTDFGLARLSGHHHSSVTNALAGTPSYMSPEALHNETIDERSDIYSLGIMLYKMVVGSTPYTASTPYGVFLKRINEPLPMPCERNPAVPKIVEELILKALADNPKQRYQSAEEFCKAIETTIANLSPQLAKKALAGRHARSTPSPSPNNGRGWLGSFLPSPIIGRGAGGEGGEGRFTFLGISSGLCATAALTLMLLFGLNSKPALSEADSIASKHSSQPALTSEQLVPASENDSWADEYDEREHRNKERPHRREERK